jgi:hypothetical protein
LIFQEDIRIFCLNSGALFNRLDKNNYAAINIYSIYNKKGKLTNPPVALVVLLAVTNEDVIFVIPDYGGH